MDAWVPYLYQYGISAVLVAGVVAAALRAGALDLKRRDDRRTLWVVAGGLLSYAALIALWIYAAGRFS